MEELRDRGFAVQPIWRARGVRSSTSARYVAAEPARIRRGQRRPFLQYRGQLRVEYQLAKLFRRSSDELPDADARTDRAELRVGGDGHGRACRADPRAGRET